MPYLLIDPDEKLDYCCDWSSFLDEGGSPSDTISSSVWLVTPQDGSPQSPDLSGGSISENKTYIFVFNCTLGQTYQLTNRIITAQGRTADRSFTLLCQHR